MGIAKEKEIVNSQTVDSKYIQQHLANERTYLAWLRTSIAIIGIGFLVTNLHYNMKESLSEAGDIVAGIIGIASVALGIIAIIMSTMVYLRKIKCINNQTFISSKRSIIALSIFIIIISLLFAAYFFLA